MAVAVVVRDMAHPEKREGGIDPNSMNLENATQSLANKRQIEE
jgi:hypothetical protein